MKKVFFTLMAASVVLAASCSKAGSGLQRTTEAQPQEIGIRALNGSVTKAAIGGTVMPTKRQLVVSTHHYKAEDPAVAGSGIDSAYFKNITFSYDAQGTEGKWREGKYWPNDGKLDFLAFSCEGYQSVAHPAASVPNIVLQLEENYDAAKSTYPGRSGINPSNVVWGDDNGCVAAKLVMEIPDNSEAQDDILYAAANGQSYTSGQGTPIAFKHAQAVLVFVPCTNISYNDTINVGITLEKIALASLKFSGKLTVLNPGVKGGDGDLSASWSDLGSTKTNYAVPCIKNYPLPVDSLKVDVNTDKYAFGANYCNTYVGGFAGEHPWAARNAGVILPPQPQTDLIITYVVHNGMDDVGNKINNRNTYVFHPRVANSQWEMGKKYIYNIKIGLEEISISPSVSDWEDTDPENVSIDPNQEQ